MNASGQIEFGLEFARRFKEDGYVRFPDFIGAYSISPARRCGGHRY